MLGLGDPLRGDDGIGPEAVRRLAALGLPGLAVRVPLDLVAHLGVPEVVIVDAVRSGAPPGTVHHLRVGPDDVGHLLPATLTSTHGLGLTAALELAGSLGRLRPGVDVLGVEGLAFGAGSGLSAPAEAGLTAVVAALAGPRAPAQPRRGRCP